MPFRRTLSALGALVVAVAFAACGGHKQPPKSVEARCLAVASVAAAISVGLPDQMNDTCTLPGIPDEQGLKQVLAKCLEYAKYAWNSDGIPDAAAATQARDKCQAAAKTGA